MYTSEKNYSNKILSGSTYTIMQNIMKIFHKAMKIRKYLRLNKNSLILSPRKSEEKLFNTANTDTYTHIYISVLMETCSQLLLQYKNSTLQRTKQMKMQIWERMAT